MSEHYKTKKAGSINPNPAAYSNMAPLLQQVSGSSVILPSLLNGLPSESQVDTDSYDLNIPVVLPIMVPDVSEGESSGVDIEYCV